MPSDRRELGAFGEFFVSQYLERCLGWYVIERNWRTRFGELDLIAENDQELVAVEVKTRTSPIGDHPISALRPAQIARLVATLSAYAARADRWSAFAVDVVGVTWRQGTVVDFRHERLYPE